MIKKTVFGFSEEKRGSDESGENPGTAIETGILFLRYQVAADLFGSFNRIINNRSWNFLLNLPQNLYVFEKYIRIVFYVHDQ